ncbi:hypothetical protein KY308_02545 [Candidatus Woesearchaeota archaeon]|nr:hypothetical protein [Candidatus Woesearchaeota archaeon]
MDWYTIKKHFKFSPEEIKSFLVTIVFLGFMFSFREWGVDSFNAAAGFFNWFNTVLVVCFALLVYISAQRLMAIRKGYRAEYKMWFYGLIIAFLVTFVTRGYIVLAFVGTAIISHLEGHRLGKFRYGLNYKDLGVISLMGPFSAIVLAVIFKIISTILPNSPLAGKLFVVCLMIACFNMLPIPWLDGGNVFFASRLLWVFSFVALLVAAVLLYFYASVLGVIIAAVFVGAISMIIWQVFVEEGF